MENGIVYTRVLAPPDPNTESITPTMLRVVETPTLCRPFALEFSSEDGAAVLATANKPDTLIEAALKADQAAVERAAREIATAGSTALRMP